MRVVVSVGRSGGNTCGEVLRFVEEDVLDKEQYSQRYSDKLKVYAGERERNKEREREGGRGGGREREGGGRERDITQHYTFDNVHNTFRLKVEMSGTETQTLAPDQQSNGRSSTRDNLAAGP